MKKTTTFEEELNEQGWLCWTNVGISMMPLLRQGRDLLLIARKGSERCRKYDTILFLRPNPDGTSSHIVHRILKVNDDGTYWVVGDNCESGDIVRDEQILGILTAVIRDGKKEISVTDLRYRLYVHLWCDCYPLRFFILHSLNWLLYHFRRLKRGAKNLLHRRSSEER